MAFDDIDEDARCPEWLVLAFEATTSRIRSSKWFCVYWLSWMCLRCLEKVKHILPNGRLMAIYHGTKEKRHLKIIQVDEHFETPNPKNHKNPDHSLPNMVPRIRNKAFESSFIRDGPILAAAQCQSLRSLHCMSPETKSSISKKIGHAMNVP